MDLNLVTQAAISGLATEATELAASIASQTAQLTAMASAIASCAANAQTELQQLITAHETIFDHEGLGLMVAPEDTASELGPGYWDSNAERVAGYVVQINFGGQVVYVPASTSRNGVE